MEPRSGPAPPGRSDSEDLRRRMRTFYRSSEDYRRLLDAHDETYLRPYVALVRRFAPAKGRLLELGAGNGLAARLFHEAGYATVGTDVSPLFLTEAGSWQRQGLAYAVCDGLQLPFSERTFDVVCSNEYLEHVPDAERALDEMRRVTAPGGRVLILGPNLCSPFVPLRELAQRLRGHTAYAIWSRGRRDALRGAWRSVRLIRAKQRARKPDFMHRQPELEARAIGGDADSAYLANPVDLERYFQRYGWRIVTIAAGWGWKGRILARVLPRYSPYLCVVVERPAAR